MDQCLVNNIIKRVNIGFQLLNFHSKLTFNHDINNTSTIEQSHRNAQRARYGPPFWRRQ
ncbi:hypothetical protein [Sphingobacterium haloxyli]|uniref:hypothetical protein n=1 Tax=Sphingobacterium haloxyli TaxID=2100533 RepID=UPI001A9FE130|nr:hypothetical protein [Sphingobacterium haloxyli]